MARTRDALRVPGVVLARSAAGTGVRKRAFVGGLAASSECYGGLDKVGVVN